MCARKKLFVVHEEVCFSSSLFCARYRQASVRCCVGLGVRKTAEISCLYMPASVCRAVW